METLQDFDTFYEEKILPSLPRLKKECRDADSWAISACVVAILGVLVFALDYSGIFPVDAVFGWIAFFTVVLAICLYQYVQRKEEFTKDFKELLIKEVIRFVNPGLVYQPDKWVPSVEYKASSLYRHRYDYYGGDDLVEGSIDGVVFRGSELLVECDSVARNRELTIFHGLFLVAVINSRFSGGTYIWSKRYAAPTGSVLDEHYRLMPMPKVSPIKSGDEAFDHFFKIGTTDRLQAEALLTPDRRTRMLRICKGIQLPLSISFVAGRCYIGVPVKDELLELDEFEPGKKEEVKKYFIIVSLIQQLIRELDLVSLA